MTKEPLEFQKAGKFVSENSKQGSECCFLQFFQQYRAYILVIVPSNYKGEVKNFFAFNFRPDFLLNQKILN